MLTDLTFQHINVNPGIALNQEIGGASESQHCKCKAVDDWFLVSVIMNWQYGLKITRRLIRLSWNVIGKVSQVQGKCILA